MFLSPALDDFRPSANWTVSHDWPIVAGLCFFAAATADWMMMTRGLKAKFWPCRRMSRCWHGKLARSCQRRQTLATTLQVDTDQRTVCEFFSYGLSYYSSALNNLHCGEKNRHDYKVAREQLTRQCHAHSADSQVRE